MQDNLYNLAFERSILSSIVFEPSQFDELSVALKTSTKRPSNRRRVYKKRAYKNQKI